ncbi:uncharacterized protein G2W53_006548 [Senna tora]|uniref:Uncharacterized protein n=1 Tax=Senna tora TaxID=362788 RepID=A0A835CE35_9FABA|nr:uncharacterized protein G2W53_006548 [Senna tora]
MGLEIDPNNKSLKSGLAEAQAQAQIPFETLSLERNVATRKIQ